MPTQLTFTGKYRYPDDPSGITIAATLGYGTESLIVTAKVDTGAEVCLFSLENGLRLGVPVGQGFPETFSSLGGNIEAYGHELTLQTGELTRSTSPNIRDCRATCLGGADGCET